jgi:hypothetical protein
MASDASYNWVGWETVAGKRAAVFAFAIDAEHSTLSFSLSDLAKATVAYHGTVYGDPETGAIFRIVNHAADFPKELQTKSISTTIDYDTVPIGEKSYLLPVQATILVVTNTGHLRNDLEFRNYRKFETDSVIRFADAGEPTAPAPRPR